MLKVADQSIIDLKPMCDSDEYLAVVPNLLPVWKTEYFCYDYV
jgi:hypothetical protein